MNIKNPHLLSQLRKNSLRISSQYSANFNATQVSAALGVITAVESDHDYKIPLGIGTRYKTTLRELDTVIITKIQPLPYITTLDNHADAPDKQMLSVLCPALPENRINIGRDKVYLIFDKSLQFHYDEARLYTVKELENFMWHIKEITTDSGISHTLICFKFSNNRQIDNVFHQPSDIELLT